MICSFVFLLLMSMEAAIVHLASDRPFDRRELLLVRKGTRKGTFSVPGIYVEFYVDADVIHDVTENRLTRLIADTAAMTETEQ